MRLAGVSYSRLVAEEVETAGVIETVVQRRTEREVAGDSGVYSRRTGCGQDTDHGRQLGR